MFCSWRTSDLALFLIWMVFSVADSSSSCVEEKQRTQNISALLSEVNTIESVLMGERALLCCPLSPSGKVIVITWKIKLRGQPSCNIAYSVDNKTSNTTCTDRRITWASSPHQSPHLQISTVNITHDGHYTCEIAEPNGNFQHSYALQVLVPPVVTLISGENGTTVCEAVAGKPAAQIHWTPEGDCVTETESHSNDTVTVRSTCSWAQNNMSAVRCFISHLTGNQTLFIHINQDVKNLGSYIPYITPPIVILIIIGSIWFFKICGFRKCKLKKPEGTPNIEEEEMQPYASYTEKSNPLYDTVSKVEALQVSQGEVDSTGLNTVSGPELQHQEK